MIPIVSMHEGSIEKHLLEVVVIFSVLFLPQSCVVKVGDAGVFGVSTDIDHFAPAC
jgi:hypothetical protein